jgi:O-acetylhomoserine/O-acetylserine sulfhydrylase-like pyridoxal-dependent enzyme
VRTTRSFDQRPIELGIGVVVHTATKYCCGLGYGMQKRLIGCHGVARGSRLARYATS